MNAFDATLVKLSKTLEIDATQILVKQLLSMGASNQAPKVKALIASILQKKYIQELQMANKKPEIVKIVDSKYQDLANLLKNTSVTGAAVNLNPNTLVSNSSQLPAKPSDFSSWSLLSSWLSHKKPFIIGASLAGTAAAAAMYAYNRFYSKKKKPEDIKNPLPTFEQSHANDMQDFERTLNVFKQIQMFNNISKADLTQEDYTTFLKKPDKALQKPHENKRSEWKKRQARWDTATSSLLKGMEEVSKGLTDFKPRKDYKLPPLDSTSIIPSYTTLGSFGTGDSLIPPVTKVQPKRRRMKRKKIDSEETNFQDNETVSEEIVEKPIKVVKDESLVASSPPKLVPVIKLAKRIRRVIDE